ncbi:unnamed protein product [Onchocerca ochengi]|uniref:Regulatory protein zeste n=1 Tax=Onchocerca ochengi TaxID=42157 RepID=A0A182E284_ONCOC|nr:unnamed protein product [Onchocerca ochengi]
MAVRNTYTMRDERLMWEYVFEKLQTGDEAVYKPKGLKLWKDFEATQKTNKTASSLATHFRKAMYDRIEEAKLSVEQQLYIASQLKIPLSKRQQITIEYKANVSIITNSLGIVTAYEKEDDDNIKDELGYDAFKLNGSMTKIAKISRKTDGNSIVACSGRYNLRKKLNIQNNNSSKIHNSEETESMDSMQDIGDCNDSQNEDRNDGDSQSEIFHAGQIFDDKKHSDSKESEVIISCPKDETDIVNFRSENDRLVNKISADQVDCLETTESESGINQHTTARSNDMKMLANEASKTVVCSNISTWAAAVVKRKQELRTFENIIDEELKQLLAYIKNKRQLRGVEKMKMEKILELRAKEAKRLGMGLRSYLRKIATITD